MISKILNLIEFSQPKNYDNIQGKYKDVLLNIYKYRDSLDVIERGFNEKEALANYKAVLQDRIKCRTIADAALVKAQKEHLIVFQHMFELHKKKLERNPEIDLLIKKAELKRFDDHPIDVYLREKLIKLGRVNLDKIKPTLKGWKKYILRYKTWL